MHREEREEVEDEPRGEREHRPQAAVVSRESRLGLVDPHVDRVAVGARPEPERRKPVCQEQPVAADAGRSTGASRRRIRRARADIGRWRGSRARRRRAGSTPPARARAATTRCGTHHEARAGASATASAARGTRCGRAPDRPRPAGPQRVGDLGDRLGERRGPAGGVDVAVAALGPLERLTRLLEPARGLRSLDRLGIERLADQHHGAVRAHLDVAVVGRVALDVRRPRR